MKTIILALGAVLLLSSTAYLLYHDSKSEALECINRQQAIKRAMEWVHAKVPYNADATHHGYIAGCEGIVADAWGLPKPGIPTWDIVSKGYAHYIDKSELLPGDGMLCQGANLNHMFLFNGWTNKE